MQADIKIKPEDSTEEQWDMELSPKHNLFDLHLKEVWEYRDLVWIMIKRDFISAYTQTILGPLWIFIQPIFTTIMFTFVFGTLAKIPTDGLPPAIFYMAGQLSWNYFNDCFGKNSSVFASNAGIFGKVYFPRLIIPITSVISNLIKLGIQMLLFIFFWIYYTYLGAVLQPNYDLLVFFPAVILLLAILGMGMGMMVSAVTTKYRDLNILVGFGMQLLFYATPVIFPLSAAPEKYKWIINLNPLSPLIELTRKMFLGVGTVDANGILYSVCFTIIAFFTGLILFNKTEKTFIDTV